MDFQIEEVDQLNNLAYCKKHGREVCVACRTDNIITNETVYMFEIPNGGPEFPSVLQNIRNEGLKKALGIRWLAMQSVIYASWPKPRIRLMKVKVPEEVRSSTAAVQGTLIQVFRDLKGEASSQRYYFANQAKIMLEDYDVFVEASVLYNEEAEDLLLRGRSLLDLKGLGDDPSQLEQGMSRKSKSSILDAFGFFLELNTERTFWRAMENTFGALISHVERFDDQKDHGAVMTDKARDCFLQCVAHLFWAVQHAQFRLNKLRIVQLTAFMRETFPFFPYTLEALDANADVHLVVAKLSKTPVHDLPRFASLFEDLKHASTFPEQMTGINAQLMAAIDELSAKFRVFQKLIMAAFLMAEQKEIKSAIATYKFNPNGTEVNSRADDVAFVQTRVRERRAPVPKRLSFLQELIMKENLFRQQNKNKIVRPPYSIDDSNGFTEGMFKGFKKYFTSMYRQSIRRQWKEHEHSFIGPEVAGRFHHRQNVEKGKKKKKPSTERDDEAVELGEIRSVPEQVYVDPSLFWEIGDGTLEKYVPPVIREKIKTRNPSNGAAEGEQRDGGMTVNEAVSGADLGTSDLVATEEAESTSGSMRRSLDRLKRSDLDTRDVLWRKMKGTLKWTQFVQFLSRLGCKILNLDGSKRKIVDCITGRCAVLHRPHPTDECRPDQLESYRLHIEDWLLINYSDVVLPSENETENSLPV